MCNDLLPILQIILQILKIKSSIKIRELSLVNWITSSYDDLPRNQL